VVAVPPELSAEPVQTFQSFTGDLYRLANWLVEIGVTTVAMESTGIYWIPVFDILEAHGLEVLLMPGMSKRFRAVRLMSTMRSGFSSCTRMACFEAVSIRLRTGPLCGCTCGIESA
jgi:transposase